MEKLFRSLEQFFISQSAELSLSGVIVNLILAALLAFVLAIVYERYGLSLSNRKMFARNFVVLAMTTVLIITIVKSSLALSLGLLGALSIIRFRTAIKEPEELSYLFINIAIGIGLGANQAVITISAFIIIVIAIILKSFSARNDENKSLLLSVSISNPAKNELENMMEVLKKHCTAVTLRRFDEGSSILDAVFTVEFEKDKSLQTAKTELQVLNESAKISFLNNERN